MWVAKIRLRDKDCIWATKCKRFKLYAYQYPLGTYRAEGGLFTMLYHILEGGEKNKEEFIKAVKRDKRVRKLEVKKDFMVSLALEKRTKAQLKVFEALYNPKLVYIKPGINFPDGWEIWEVGCFDRKELVNLFNLCKKKYSGELLFLKQVKVPKIFTPEIMPELTGKQYRAFKAASQEGYYDFPRKTNLYKLAQSTKTSRPTFEEHLRKAENKLLKFMRELILR